MHDLPRRGAAKAAQLDVIHDVLQRVDRVFVPPVAAIVESRWPPRLAAAQPLGNRSDVLVGGFSERRRDADRLRQQQAQPVAAAKHGELGVIEGRRGRAADGLEPIFEHIYPVDQRIYAVVVEISHPHAPRARVRCRQCDAAVLKRPDHAKNDGLVWHRAEGRRQPCDGLPCDELRHKRRQAV